MIEGENNLPPFEVIEAGYNGAYIGAVVIDGNERVAYFDTGNLERDNADAHRFAEK